MKDRRREPRFSGEMKILLEPAGERGGPGPVEGGQACLSCDISPGGVRILLGQPFPLGTELLLEIALPRPRAVVHVMGLVRWTREFFGQDVYEIGLEFVNPSAKVLGFLLLNAYDQSRRRLA